MAKLNLKNIVIDATEVEYAFPACKGMKVTLAYVNRTLLSEIREQSMTKEFDAEAGMPVPKLDGDKYLINYAKAVVKGWTGFTYAHLASLILIDEDAVNLEEEIDFDLDTVVYLMQNSQVFDTWVVTSAKQLENFRK